VVGIVIVSHSRRLAEGVAELAREMGGPDARLETAGGLALEGNPIGTDAVLVSEAIERAWSEDGVLVLMDLGSAVLSAEMALDMLAEDRREAVLLCEAPLVEGAVAAAVAAKLGLTLDAVAEEARGGLAGKAAHLGSEAPALGVPPPRRSGPARSIVLSVELPHGLHARPAARLVQVASGFDADVDVANRTTGRGPVSARSLNAVATLGVARGHQMEVTAVGPEANAAIDAVGDLAGRSFDEAPESGPAAAPPGFEAEVEGALRGITASPGIALGRARRFHVPALDVPDRGDASDPAAERRTLDEAIEAARVDVERQRAATGDRLGDYEATIFDAHLLFLRDEALIEPARRAIESEGRPAAVAWRDAVEAVAASWEALSDEYLRARVQDLRSVGRQVLARILGVPLPAPTLEGPGILVVADLSPAEAAALDPATVKGIASAFGAPTSHASIIARALGIPAVVATGPDLLAISDGRLLGVDASAGGLVYVDPTSDVAAALDAASAALAADRREARAGASKPASTTDGEGIEVAANVGSVREVAAAVEEGADGVGLFRTELLFLEAGPISEEAQADVYRRAAQTLAGRPLTIRTLDAGADKPVPGLQQPAERNPFLGMRGVRLGLDRPELLETQLRAVLQVARDHPLRVMFPMVATLDELMAAREVLDRARRTVGGDPSLEVGIMVEVPSAALIAEVLAPNVDFFSVGTNDLTQYALAADRGDPRLAALTDPLHPAVLRLIHFTVEAARGSGRWVGVCGELAGDPDATALLVGIGVRELSMSAPSVPLVKRAVRVTGSREASELATAAMALPSASAVRALLTRRS
jgi:phosphoenolpyruvate-protein phosphotransferase/dihydroxyacetone kinase phosphotransfer subunit